MERAKTIFLYLFFVGGCGLVMLSCAAVKKKESTTVITERDSVAYVMPSTSELVLSEICDTLQVRTSVFLKSDDGPVRTEVRAEGNKVVVKTEYDTIFKDRIVEKEVVKTVTEETVRYKWAKITWLFLGIIILFLIAPAIPYAINKMIFRGLL